MEHFVNKDISLFIISLISSYVLYKIFIPIFSRYLIDQPNFRSLHKLKSPTGGGIIFAILISIFSLIKGTYIPLFCLPLSFIGLLDDKKNLSQIIRIISQLITILILFIAGFYFDDILPWIDTKLFYLLIIPIIFSCVGIINFLNFSDGINGLLAGTMLVFFCYYLFDINDQFIFVIPCLFIFLIFNWSPSKIFMGDSGSLFLGSLYVYVILISKNLNEFISLIFILIPILMDVLSALLRRFYYGHNIFKPHRLHLYQRLVSAGFTHSQVSLLYISFSLLFCLLNIYGDFKLIIILSLIMFFIGFYLDQNIAVPFYIKEYNQKLKDKSNY